MNFDGYSVTIQPAAEPVTVAELKDWLRLDGSDQDTMLSSMITAARVSIEEHTRRSFVQRSIVQSLAGFPAGGCIELVRPPLASVTSVKYYDTDNDQQTIDSSNYLVDVIREPGVVRPIDTYDWPSVYERSDAVQITFVAGYSADATSVPETMKALTKMIAADMFEHPEAQSELRLTENKQWKFLLESLQLKDLY
jgi:uncharacterized phiE125 gp8 family phage protein